MHQVTFNGPIARKPAEPTASPSTAGRTSTAGAPIAWGVVKPGLDTMEQCLALLGEVGVGYAGGPEARAQADAAYHAFMGAARKVFAQINPYEKNRAALSAGDQARYLDADLRYRRAFGRLGAMGIAY